MIADWQDAGRGNSSVLRKSCLERARAVSLTCLAETLLKVAGQHGWTSLASPLSSNPERPKQPPHSRPLFRFFSVFLW